MQHTSNVVSVSGQHQLQLHQSSPSWWAWGPPSPPNPWNWNMWSPRAFHQLSLTSPTGQHTISQTAGVSNQFVGFPPTTTMATSRVTASTATTEPVQQEHQSQEQLNPPHWAPSASSNSTSPVSNPPDNTEEEQPDPLISALSFSTAPGYLPEQNLYFLCMYLHPLRKESGQASMSIWLTSWKPNQFQRTIKHINFLVPTQTLTSLV